MYFPPTRKIEFAELNWARGSLGRKAFKYTCRDWIAQNILDQLNFWLPISKNYLLGMFRKKE